MTNHPIEFPGEEQSNEVRSTISHLEPRALRTYTPTQAVLARSAGIWHWTPEGRRLYDYTSGVLVANLGHNPRAWLERLWGYLGWSTRSIDAHAPHLEPSSGARDGEGPWTAAVPLTAYNAITPIEAEAVRRLLANLHTRPGGKRLEQVFWAASGSEAVQKALWATLARDPGRDIILATRDGFHGKKGLAGACTGRETDPERDPRIRFISFPVAESMDVDLRGAAFDPTPYERELTALKGEFGGRLSCIITEPYLGGAGSFHPPAEYLQLLERFCRNNDLVFILDEVQSNFGRTGRMYAFETYGIEPDIVVLGKGMGNGAPVAAAAGRRDVLESLDYGAGSDTYSANPFCCAAVLATLDLFESDAFDVLGHGQQISRIVEQGLLALKDVPFVTHVRGEGMVWGVEVGAYGELSDREVAVACVRACYLGDEQGNAIHLMGPLAGNVLRISPPMIIGESDARASLECLGRIFRSLAEELAEKGTTSLASGA